MLSFGTIKFEFIEVISIHCLFGVNLRLNLHGNINDGHLQDLYSNAIKFISVYSKPFIGMNIESIF